VPVEQHSHPHHLPEELLGLVVGVPCCDPPVDVPEHLVNQALLGAARPVRQDPDDRVVPGQIAEGPGTVVTGRRSADELDVRLPQLREVDTGHPARAQPADGAHLHQLHCARTVTEEPRSDFATCRPTKHRFRWWSVQY
jgi:hypothetical protein